MALINETLDATTATMWNSTVDFLISNITVIDDESNVSISPTDPPYCGKQLFAFKKWYSGLHGYISLIVCLFGSVANVLNIMVLTRKEMVSPTNAILTGLAVADLLVMVEYIPFTCHMYISNNRPIYERYTYGWAIFVLVHAHFTQVFHTISIWLTVTLAVWRYIAIGIPQRNREWCNMERAMLAIASAYVCSAVLCIPSYLSFSINIRYIPPGDINGTVIYLLDLSEFAKANNRFLENVNFWTYSVIIKIFPCVALTILSWRLISALLEAKQRKMNLTKRTQSVGSERKHNESERQTDRTTRMLLAVLLLFLITEFPQGILALLSGILGDNFFKNCYVHLGEIMDILALINSAINFILYCSMSRQFRETFQRLFKPKILNKWALVPQTEMTVNSTHV